MSPSTATSPLRSINGAIRLELPAVGFIQPVVFIGTMGGIFAAIGGLAVWFVNWHPRHSPPHHALPWFADVIPGTFLLLGLAVLSVAAKYAFQAVIVEADDLRLVVRLRGRLSLIHI